MEASTRRGAYLSQRDRTALRFDGCSFNAQPQEAPAQRIFQNGASRRLRLGVKRGFKSIRSLWERSGSLRVSGDLLGIIARSTPKWRAARILLNGAAAILIALGAQGLHLQDLGTHRTAVVSMTRDHQIAAFTASPPVSDVFWGLNQFN